jgi:hypothetical protein
MRYQAMQELLDHAERIHAETQTLFEQLQATAEEREWFFEFSRLLRYQAIIIRKPGVRE